MEYMDNYNNNNNNSIENRILNMYGDLIYSANQHFRQTNSTMLRIETGLREVLRTVNNNNNNTNSRGPLFNNNNNNTSYDTRNTRSYNGNSLYPPPLSTIILVLPINLDEPALLSIDTLVFIRYTSS